LFHSYVRVVWSELILEGMAEDQGWGAVMAGGTVPLHETAVSSALRASE